MRYGFAFRTDDADARGADHHWFKVGQILNKRSADDLENLIEQEQERLSDGTTKEQSRVLRHNLTRLHEVVWKEDAIWYHTEHKQDYDRVLDIFVRANSGGTTLSKSDLLLSTITAGAGGAPWRREPRARLSRRVGDGPSRRLEAGRWGRASGPKAARRPAGPGSRGLPGRGPHQPTLADVPVVQDLDGPRFMTAQSLYSKVAPEGAALVYTFKQRPQASRGPA